MARGCSPGNDGDEVVRCASVGLGALTTLQEWKAGKCVVVDELVVPSSAAAARVTSVLVGII